MTWLITERLSRLYFRKCFWLNPGDNNDPGLHLTAFLTEQIILVGVVMLSTEQYKGASDSVRLALAGLEAKPFLIGILSYINEKYLLHAHRKMDSEKVFWG